MNWGAGIKVLTCLLCIFLFGSICEGALVEYTYDDAGRLVKVISGNNRALYRYDEVGNLLSIKSETTTLEALPPVLESIEPDILFIGDSYQVTITGQNLLSTTDITSDSPYVTITNFIAIDTTIYATLSIDAGASPGQADVTVTTAYGSATIPITMYQVEVEPNPITLYDLSSANLAISLTPAAPKDVRISINNLNADIVSTNTSPSVVIPAGGQAGVMIQALKAGLATISVGNAEAKIYVIDDPSLINAAPVTVGIGALPNNSVIFSKAVTVGGMTALSEVVASRQVGVQWPIQEISVSQPVCVGR
jgi:YD repeat-containing protein